MTNRCTHRTVFTVAFLWCAALHAAPATPTLTGTAYNSTSILWTWTAAGAGTTFTLFTSTNGVIATQGGTSSSYIEGDLPAGTAISRKLQQSDGTGTSTSTLTTVATPDASVTVPAGSAATLIGSDNLTRASLSAGALPGPGQGQLNVSIDPVNKPITGTTPALIAAANTALGTTRIAIPASVREFTALANSDPYSTTFNANATLQIPYSDNQRPGFVDNVTPEVPVRTLTMMTLDTATGRWVALSNVSLDTTNKVLTAPVSHFSIYGLFGSEGQADLSTLKVYPSPWRPGSGGSFDDAQGIHFHGLTPTATIKIFTITGDLVRRIEKQVTDGNEIIWDGRNDNGEKVASAVYFYLVTDPASGQQVKNRFGILR